MGVRISLPLQIKIITMSRVSNYIKSSYDELVNKVSWPTMQELQSSAIVVAVASLIFAIIVFLMDFVFGAQNMEWKGILGYFYEIFK